MPLPTVNISQFVGEIKINISPYQQAQFNAYVDQFYEAFARSVIGSEAVDIIKNQDPLAQKWVDLFAGVYYFNEDQDKRIQTKGLTYSVLRVLYFYYKRDNFDSTESGNVEPMQEAAKRQSNARLGQLLAVRWNNAMNAINCDLKEWLDNYEDYSGTISGFTDNGGGSYTIQTGSTLYLANDDKVKINGVEYTVANLIEDTSFDIVGEEGLSFFGFFVYNPFEAVEFCKQEYII